MSNPVRTEARTSMTQRPSEPLRSHLCKSLWLSTTLLVLFALGCGEADKPTTTSDTSLSEASWADDLPLKASKATSDQQWFWAAVPDGAGAKISLIQNHGGGNGWHDSLGRPIEVPAALVHEFTGSEAVDGDAPQMVYVAGQGLVAGLCSGAVEERSCRIDWNGETVTQGPPVSVASMESSPWRIYGGSTTGFSEMRGFEIARHEATVWLLNAGGQVEKHPRDSVRSQDIRVDWKVGDSVAAFDWANGFRRGEIAEVLEEDLRFLVRLDDGSSGSYFFDRLSAPTG